MGHGTAGEGALHPGAIEFKLPPRARDRSPTLEQVRISTGREYPRTLPPQTPAQGAVHGQSSSATRMDLSRLGVGCVLGLGFGGLGIEVGGGVVGFCVGVVPFPVVLVEGEGVGSVEGVVP